MDELTQFLTTAPLACNQIVSHKLPNQQVNQKKVNQKKVNQKKVNQKKVTQKNVAQKNGDDQQVSCVLWTHNGESNFFMTGTDIVRILVFKFNLIERPIINMKKFEEGVFSDLRRVPGITLDAKSDFLNFLTEHSCIRTIKKQKIFYWDKIDHNFLFLSALKKDLIREANGQQATSVPTLNYCPERVIKKISPDLPIY